MCTAALIRARDVGDLASQADLLRQMAVLDLHAGRNDGAAARLNEPIQIALRAGSRSDLLDALNICGHLSAQTGHHAEAVTLWARHATLMRHEGTPIGRYMRVTGTNLGARPDKHSAPPGRGRPKNAAQR